MSDFSLHCKVHEAPVLVRRWLERKFERQLSNSEELSIWCTKHMTKKKREHISDRWERERKRRKSKLARVATKMRKLGMSERDVTVVRRGGWDDFK